MGFFDRVRNLVTGRGWTETPVAPAPSSESREVSERRGGFGGFVDRLTGADRRREEVARQADLARDREELRQMQDELRQMRDEMARQEQERQADFERQREALEREREALEQQRQEAERERAEQERQREEQQEREREAQQRQEREQVEHEQWRRDLGVDQEITGARGWTIYTVRTPEELRDRLEDAAMADKRVGLSVHDKNGWHQIYANRGRGHYDAAAGRNVGGGAGMSAGEMLRRFEEYGYPGQDGVPGPVVTHFEPGEDEVLEGPEWDYDDGADYSGDYYDYIGESDGGADGDTEGYDPGSVNGYQIIVYN